MPLYTLKPSSMTKIFDWKNTEDPRDVVHLAVQAVAEGHIVAVPGDCFYLLVGSGIHPSTVSKMGQLAQLDQNSIGLTLMMRSASELLDYFPTISASVRRFASKAWPAPLALDLEDTHPSSLLRCLDPESIAQMKQKSGKIRTSQASHPLFEDMGKLLAGPLLAAPAVDSRGRLARNLASITEQCYTIGIDDGETSPNGLPTLLEFEQNRAKIMREGILPLDYLKTLSRWTVLFVCTGNTCRSPMAQALMNRKIAERFGTKLSPKDFPVSAMSAGIAAYGGDAASPGAINAMMKYKIRLENHCSSQLTRDMVDQADLILTMGSRHKHVIVSQWPNTSNKVHLLSPDGAEITDPFGGPLDVYEHCAEQLDRYTDYWLEQLNVTELIEWQS